MLLFLMFCFVGLPIMELFLLLEVGERIGGWDTVGIVLVTGLVGAVVARSQGQQVWNRIQGDMKSGKLPADSLVEGVLIFVGGLLLITPGFITDVIGFSMVLPGSRLIFIKAAKQFLMSRMKTGQFHVRMGRMDEYGYHWEDPAEVWKDVSPEDPRSFPRGPADVIDINSARRSRDVGPAGEE